VIIGATSGFACAFGAPMGGMLYVWEELTTHWDNRRHTAFLGVRAFLGVAVSSLVLKVIVGLSTHTLNIQFYSVVIFDGRIYEGQTWSYKDLIYFLILSVFVGALTGVYTRAALWITNFQKSNAVMKNKWMQIIFPPMLAILTAVVFSLSPHITNVCKPVPSPADLHNDDLIVDDVAGGE
jgi:H+/Cl- antiporter ClcA